MNTLIRAGLPCLAIAAGGAVAHGDEPHGDAPHPQAAVAATGPRFEASTNLFEVVGRLQDGALTLWVNRFATGEPVTGATVELELGALKATAAPRAQQGDYVVSDTAFVAALASPGQHALVLTVSAGDDADLLETTVAIAAPLPTDGAAGGAGRSGRLAGAALLTLAVAAGLGLLWRRHRRAAQETTA